VALGPTHVFWVDREGCCGGYNCCGGRLMKAPIDGGQPVVLAALTTSLVAPWSMAADSVAVYWVGFEFVQPPVCTLHAVNPLVGSLQRVGIDGGTPVTLASLPTERSPSSGLFYGSPGVAVDDTCVYWTTLTQVMKLAKP
jgi:hypothetical protein